MTVMDVSLSGVRASEAPAGGPARLDGQQTGRPAGSDAVHVPRRWPGGRGAEVGGERDAAVVDARGPATGRPPVGHLDDELRVGDHLGVALDDEVELLGGDAERAARVAGDVPALAR